eukprot:CAMPEP_0119344240 /NCGR_PEP_ID=MMETSP1333-20130426/106868_1 /TAXON_ID=418940 /ORGANISM="Scyphosphaera apsteinii, Strain RCC1455" /LENGTH=168 /DNA_ID=CAMNT_0007356671 /DNA_START=97 /DNA_END=603 /DNA_ORIENTATION=-
MPKRRFAHETNESGFMSSDAYQRLKLAKRAAKDMLFAGGTVAEAAAAAQAYGTPCVGSSSDSESNEATVLLSETQLALEGDRAHKPFEDLQWAKADESGQALDCTMANLEGDRAHKPFEDLQWAKADESGQALDCTMANMACKEGSRKANADESGQALDCTMANMAGK